MSEWEIIDDIIGNDYCSVIRGDISDAEISKLIRIMNNHEKVMSILKRCADFKITTHESMQNAAKSFVVLKREIRVILTELGGNMTEKHKQDYPAFPHKFGHHPGMALRQYYAGQALVGILGSNMVKVEMPVLLTEEEIIEKQSIFESIAIDAVAFADALMEELGK